ncbi:hypothetical protein OUZ56_010518 [Daphnia magna]|uniref:Uncharacterized protein n=1 Tax=Daphnia magna TaxID=35525 RepID=A0ABR0AIR4_9CRUS|nr:hypothetical protein OUZ56_010518 [Daphnia magna]
MDGAGRVDDTGVDRMAANDSHSDFPSANIFKRVLFTVWIWRSTKPFDWANSGLDVTCLTPIRRQNSRNSALQNWVPLSDSLKLFRAAKVTEETGYFTNNGRRSCRLHRDYAWPLAVRIHQQQFQYEEVESGSNL